MRSKKKKKKKKKADREWQAGGLHFVGIGKN
jgi:hypothetical protein